MSMSIEERLDRLESLDEIRQLAAKYSVTLDMRDLDMHVNLFVPDVRVGKMGRDVKLLKHGLIPPLEINLRAPLIILAITLLNLSLLTLLSAWCIQRMSMKQRQIG